MESMNFYLEAFSLILISLAIIFTIGIVWRVELKLDWSYKIFCAALFFLLISEILKYFEIYGSFVPLAGSFSRFLFFVFLFWGILIMRNLIREVDGEKQEEKDNL